MFETRAWSVMEWRLYLLKNLQQKFKASWKFLLLNVSVCTQCFRTKGHLMVCWFCRAWWIHIKSHLSKCCIIKLSRISFPKKNDRQEKRLNYLQSWSFFDLQAEIVKTTFVISRFSDIQKEMTSFLVVSKRNDQKRPSFSVISARND